MSGREENDDDGWRDGGMACRELASESRQIECERTTCAALYSALLPATTTVTLSRNHLIAVGRLLVRRHFFGSHPFV